VCQNVTYCCYPSDSKLRYSRSPTSEYVSSRHIKQAINQSISRLTSQQHVSAAVVRPIHKVEGKPLLCTLPQCMSFEISTHRFAYSCLCAGPKLLDGIERLMRILAQGSALCLFWTISELLGVDIPKSFPKKVPDDEYQLNEQTGITSKQYKINTKFHWNMKIKSGLPFPNLQI